MRRLAFSFAVCVCALSAQTKKIVVTGGPGVVKELEGASPKVRLVPVTKDSVMKEIGDADAYIGVISPAEVRAGKNLKWVGVMAAGVENVLFLSGGNDLRDSN